MSGPSFAQRIHRTAMGMLLLIASSFSSTITTASLLQCAVSVPVITSRARKEAALTWS